MSPHPVRHPDRLRLLHLQHGGAPGDVEALETAIAACLKDARAGRIRRLITEDALKVQHEPRRRMRNDDALAIDADVPMTICSESVRPQLAEDELPRAIVDALDRRRATDDEAEVVMAGLAGVASMLDCTDPRIGVQCPVPWLDSIAYGDLDPVRTHDPDLPNRIEIPIDPQIDAILPDMTIAILRDGTLILAARRWRGWRQSPIPDAEWMPMPDTMEALRAISRMRDLSEGAGR